MTAIHVEKLIKNFGQVHALDGLELEVKTGSVFGFLGPNGAGKTTTLRILAGLALPTSGTVTIMNKVISNSTPQPSKNIGYLPEEPAFYPWMTPIEYLGYVGRLFGLKATEVSSRSVELLRLTGLTDVSKRKIGGFSRGMRQRLGVAQALVNHPDILLLDEPVSALDPSGRKDVLELILTLAKQCTVVMSSHILADVERVCDTVAIIDKGKTLVQAEKQTLMERFATPALELELGNHNGNQMDTWKGLLGGLDGISGIAVDGYVLRIAVADMQAAQKAIIQKLMSNQVTIVRFEVVTPSLEDIFLKLVNHTEVTK
jgi:ABC-2 type transport system ATP-binding protein